MGVGDGDRSGRASALVGKRGRVVVTNLHPAAETTGDDERPRPDAYEKQVVGSLFGSANPRRRHPQLLELYRSGQLELDELVTRTYRLDEVNDGYEDMREGRNLRGVLTF